MRVFVTGGTGFIGRALVPRLQRDGHTIVAWARLATRARALLGADVEIVTGALGGRPAVEALRSCDGIVNLAGEPIVGKRWTAARRARLEQSRVGLTEQLVDAMAAAGMRRSVLVSGSAVGYYGDRGDESLTESSAHGDDFLAQLCIRWEMAARKAENLGARVVLLRTGVVLGRAGGALAQMLPPFRVGAGGPIGSGRQYFPWIHLYDLVAIVAAALTDSSYLGPINAVAPEQATARDFARALGHALNRPAVLPVPAIALKLIFGEAAIVLLASQRVEPRELMARGFGWELPRLDAALDDVLHDRVATIVHRGEADGRYELRAKAVVNAPVDQTFAFFSKAENLGLLTPASMKFSIDGIAPAMQTGSVIDYHIALGPAPLRWRTRIAGWESGRSFVDIQEEGPYKQWRHRHAFQEEGARTVMDDQVLYTPPFGLFGRIAHWLFIAPALRRIFQYRSDVIRLRFG